MMKKEEDSSSALAASSSRRANSPKNARHAKTNIGCMSGLLRFVYSYSNRSGGKFITSGKRQEKNSISSSLQQEKPNANGIPRSSYNVPRSPTLPVEIRRSNSVKSPESTPATPPSAVLMAETAAEKRRKLLEALEKCDEDLKALKRIIDVVKSSVSTADDNNNNNNENFSGRENKCLSFKENYGGNKSVEVNGELQPSPVSVLEDFITPATLTSGYSRRYTNGRAMQQQMKQKQKKKPGEDDEMSSICFLDKIRGESIQAKSTNNHDQEKVASPLWASKAMIESVNEVCRDIAWGEKREIGRIGLALQDRICRDLIEEIVRELECCAIFTLPFEACKRSLRF